MRKSLKVEYIFNLNMFLGDLCVVINICTVQLISISKFKTAINYKVYVSLTVPRPPIQLISP